MNKLLLGIVAMLAIANYSYASDLPDPAHRSLRVRGGIAASPGVPVKADPAALGIVGSVSVEPVDVSPSNAPSTSPSGLAVRGMDASIVAIAPPDAPGPLCLMPPCAADPSGPPGTGTRDQGTSLPQARGCAAVFTSPDADKVLVRLCHAALRLAPDKVGTGKPMSLPPIYRAEASARRNDIPHYWQYHYVDGVLHWRWKRL